MNPLKIVTGFIPQVVFMIVVNWLPLGEAAAVGLAAAAVLIAVTAARGGVKTLPVVQAVILAVFTAVGYTVGSHPAATFEPYARGTASLALGAFIVATCAWFPFTAQFARASVPPKLWRSPQFLAVNRRLSLAWGLAVLAVGAAHIAAALIDGAPIVRLLLDWGVPAFALYRAYAVTKRTVAEGKSHPGADQPAAPLAH